MIVPALINKLTEDTGDDSSTQLIATVNGYARQDKPKRVAEWIAGNVGHFLRLPVAPVICGVQRNDPTALHIISLNVDPNRKRWCEVSDADLDEYAKANPDVTTGILLFDLLISNPDRNGYNLILTTLGERHLLLIDHDHAFQLEKSKYSEVTQGNFAIACVRVPDGFKTRHCLLDRLTTAQHMRKWIDRIKTIPDWLLQEWERDCIQLGLHAEAASELVHRLRTRRDSIEQIVLDHRHEFSKVTDFRADGTL